MLNCFLKLFWFGVWGRDVRVEVGLDSRGSSRGKWMKEEISYLLFIGWYGCGVERDKRIILDY